MPRILLLLAAGVAICSCQQSGKQPVRCGLVPEAIQMCLGNPKLVPASLTSACKSRSETQCERMTCIFESSGWLTKDGKIDKAAVRKYFEEFVVEHSVWSAAASQVKAGCLGDATLSPQGVYVSCPAYDIVHCAFTAFIKNAAAQVWQSGAACEAARAYAEACPVCPEDCFAPAIPLGSCNACRLLPRSP